MKLFLILSIIFLQFEANAQLTTVLNVNKPAATISEWYRNNATITYLVSKTDSMPQLAVIKATIKTIDGNIVATKDMTMAQAFTLGRGTKVFFAKDVLPLEIMNFTRTYNSVLQRTGKLPAGGYIIEVQLLKPQEFTPLSTLQSRTFNLVATQLPVLMKPANNDSLDIIIASTAITFRWTPLIPSPTTPAYYRLQVFQVMPFQHPLQALRGNTPVLDIEVRGITQYIWRPQLNFKTDSLARKFIWTIQSLDNNRMPLSSDNNIEARSEPVLFSIKNPIY
jgi:hypothetical protein